MKYFQKGFTKSMILFLLFLNTPHDRECHLNTICPYYIKTTTFIKVILFFIYYLTFKTKLIELTHKSVKILLLVNEQYVYITCS